MTLKSGAFNHLKLSQKNTKGNANEIFGKRGFTFLKSARQLRLFGFNRKNDKKDLQKAKIIASINNCRRAMSRKARGPGSRQKKSSKSS